MLRDVFPSLTWNVIVFNGETTTHFSSHFCNSQSTCISAVRLLNRYNILAVGFDQVTQSPNTKLLVSQTWRTQLSALPSNDAFVQTYSLSGNFCFAAMLSLVGEHNPVWSLPTVGAGQYYQIVR
jgi:hypothetical protein